MLTFDWFGGVGTDATPEPLTLEKLQETITRLDPDGRLMAEAWVMSQLKGLTVDQLAMVQNFIKFVKEHPSDYSIPIDPTATGVAR